MLEYNKFQLRKNAIIAQSVAPLAPKPNPNSVTPQRWIGTISGGLLYLAARKQEAPIFPVLASIAVIDKNSVMVQIVATAPRTDKRAIIVGQIELKALDARPKGHS